ncbi:MAG TPA: carboxymuconolactone decarboxylase family protein [Pseudomonadota bacterium]|nr:carboxymuconolactone decarboxylase family protein [Pseudomonadota bacterium]
MQSPPIIPLVQDGEGSEEVQALFARIRAAIGFVPNLFRLWANAPHLLPTLVQMETTICGSGKVPARLKELAAYRTSELNGCPYCAAFHGHNVKQLGYDASQVQAVQAPAPPEASLFSEEELAVLALADEMTRQVNARPETLDRIRSLFGVDGTVELMATIALLNFDNRMAFSAQTPPDDFSSVGSG